MISYKKPHLHVKVKTGIKNRKCQKIEEGAIRLICDLKYQTRTLDTPLNYTFFALGWHTYYDDATNETEPLRVICNNENK